MNRLVTPSVITAQLAGSWTFSTLPACFHETGFTMNRLSRHGKPFPHRCFSSKVSWTAVERLFPRTILMKRERSHIKIVLGKSRLTAFCSRGAQGCTTKTGVSGLPTGVSCWGVGRRSTVDARLESERILSRPHDGLGETGGEQPLSPRAPHDTPCWREAHNKHVPLLGPPHRVPRGAAPPQFFRILGRTRF